MPNEDEEHTSPHEVAEVSRARLQYYICKHVPGKSMTVSVPNEWVEKQGLPPLHGSDPNCSGSILHSLFRQRYTAPPVAQSAAYTIHRLSTSQLGTASSPLRVTLGTVIALL